MEEGNRLALKKRSVVDTVANLPDRRMRTGEVMVDGHLALSMLMDLGDR